MALKHLSNLFGNKINTLPLLVLYLTDGCNSRCAMCDIWRSPRRNMNMALVDELVHAAQQLNVRWVLLSGGEAMQHPNWDQIAKRFFDAGIYVMLLTNALLLERHVNKLTQSVHEVIVSLDAATPATYQQIRGVDGLERVLGGIQAAHKIGIPVTTRTTLQRLNYTQMPGIIEKAIGAGASSVSFLAVDTDSMFAFGNRESTTLNNPQHTCLSPEDCDAFETVLNRVETQFQNELSDGTIAEPIGKLRDILQYFRALNGEQSFHAPRCNAPHISTVVEVDGRVRSCYFLPEIGDMKTTTLPQILNSPTAAALRQAYRSGQRQECARCVCPLYKGPRALARL